MQVGEKVVVSPSRLFHKNMTSLTNLARMEMFRLQFTVQVLYCNTPSSFLFPTSVHGGNSLVSIMA